MATGIARGDGFAAGVAPAATTPTVPIVVVTATAPTPAAFMKFLREYSMVQSSSDFLRQFGNSEKSKKRRYRLRSGRQTEKKERDQAPSEDVVARVDAMAEHSESAAGR